MDPRDLEPEMEDMLLRLVLNLAAEWEGATEEEIARIEALAGRPLPRFYRWFLLRMGHSMGPLTRPWHDYSVSAVLACNSENVSREPRRRLIIGDNSGDELRKAAVYDFDYPVRDDARVTNWETFREDLAWAAVLNWGVLTRSQRCYGVMYEDPAGESSARLDRVMKSLGFEAPIATGPRCAVFLRPDANVIMFASLNDELPRWHFLRLGASDKKQIESILREISTGLSVEIETDDAEWDPPL